MNVKPTFPVKRRPGALRPTAETRELAAYACAVMASSSEPRHCMTCGRIESSGHAVFCLGLGELADVPACAFSWADLELGVNAADLAREALWAVPAHPLNEDRVRWAEAECLLREGWRPGQDVVR